LVLQDFLIDNYYVVVITFCLVDVKSHIQ
jgi:hypothetical protein